MKIHLDVDFDDVLTKVGVFGRWQQRTVVLLMIASFIGGLPMMNTAVTAQMPKQFYCQSRDCHPRWSKTGQANAYWKQLKKPATTGPVHLRSFNLKKPVQKLGLMEGTRDHDDHHYDEMCHVVDCDFLPEKGLLANVSCNEAHIYWTEGLPMNNSVFTMTKSLCIKLNFDHELYKTILDILYMVGIFLGGEFFIHLGSSHGRRFSLGLAMFMTLIGSSIGLIRYIEVYALSRFVSGFGAISCYLMAWHLVIETLKKDAKVFGDNIGITYFSVIANFLSIAYAVGEATTALIATIFDKYEDFLMCISVICGASMLILFFLPESPHWFILNGKREEFLATMKEAAGHNRSQVNDLEDLVPHPEPRDKELTRALMQMSIWSPQLLFPTLSLIFLWMSCGIIYYGINSAVDHFEIIPNHPFSSIAVIALAEIPAYLVNAFLMDIVGRKPLILFNMFLAAVSCVVTLLLEKDNQIFKVSILLLKASVAGAYTLIRIYTIELYPWVLKEKAFGLCKALASFASIFSPLVYYVNEQTKQLSLIIFLSVSLFLILTTGILFIFLPDTIGFSTPRDMEDVQYMKKHSKPVTEMDLSGWKPPICASSCEDSK